jgi:hypothetical protein
MAPKTKPPPHPPFDPNQLLVHLKAIGLEGFKVQKDDFVYANRTSYAFSKGGNTIRIEETEQFTRTEVWTRSPPVSTGRRSVAMKRPGEWRNNRKFFCKQGIWPYSEMADMMKRLCEVETAAQEATKGWQALVKTLADNGFPKLGYSILQRSGSGPEATLTFSYLTASQAIVLLKAASAIGVKL